ncbi:isocitrate lyase/PEP mutase family protein [Maritalea porphyrae]|uniref:isocitrate lyase/PEP mutase family protein n=1 Tax=Maritalea porphyrae TaxID=880732 RepID=UPI0022B01841|nr:isocitrate lyase/phosphoenolpyruvate mutase family protein [Maritalea porphyrae]MCZ4271068.1 isocitrate lyase/phosphoenolpyruvate mutase family protein [Maritalea porphyrae]
MSQPSDFRKLHQSGDPFILANAWDIGSARMMESLGAKAVATSSAALAFVQGVGDLGEISRDDALAHADELNRAVNVPLNGDFENGFGPTLDDVVKTIKASDTIGIAGCGIEDMDLPTTEPYAFERAVERIEAAAEAARALPYDFVLTARADGVMHAKYDLDEAIRRLQAFQKAGADVLFAPMPGTIDDVARICREVEGPINAICAGPFTQNTVAEFANVGVARISLGSSLARITHRAIFDAATAMFGDGDLSLLGNSISGDQIEKLIKR